MAPASRRDPALWAIAGLAALLIFGSLGGRCLWQDEAETALLAKSILRTGLPIAYDGTNLVSQETGREFGPDFLWRWSPWVQFYVAAASIGLLGPTALAARLPFALLGLLTIPAIYLLALRLFDSVAVARLSALYLTLSVPFLLHARQARWHSPSCLLVVLLFISLAGLAHDRRLAGAALALSAALLFYTNYFVALGALLALLASAPCLRPEKRFVRVLLAWLAAAAALLLPGVVFFGVLGKEGAFDPARTASQLWAYTGSAVTFLLPLPMVALVLYLLIEASGSNPDGTWKRGARFLMVFSAVYIGFISAGPWMMFRYLILLLPPAALLLALGTSWILDRSRPAGVAVLLVLVLTNALHLFPLGLAATAGTRSADTYPSVGPIGSPLLGYLYELTHPSDEPECVVSRYLEEHARPGDVVLASYGDLPLQFYTRLKVVGGLEGRPLPETPDWIFARRFVMSADPGKDLDVVRFIQSRIDAARYEAIDLPGGDSMVANNPDPAFHLFRAPGAAPPLVLLHRVEPSRRAVRPG